MECRSEAGRYLLAGRQHGFLSAQRRHLKGRDRDQIVDEEALAYCEDVYARWLKKSAEERAAMMKPLFGNLTCEICGGTMTKVSETEAVCTQNETHRRKLKENISS